MKWSIGISVLVLVVSTLYLGYIPEQSDFNQIIASATMAFLGYGLLAFYFKPSVKMIFLVGVGIRVVLIYAFPNLSDDIYRFLWDGQLTGLGLNPYGYLPSELNGSVVGLNATLFEKMNSPDYYTIYPPFAQLIFYISTWFSEDIFRMSLVIKFFFLLAEIFTFLGLIKVLEALKMDVSKVSIYFLNPLIIVEGMVNLHFEIIMIVFLVWSLYFIFVRQNLIKGAFLFALSISAKLLPLMFLPYFFFKMSGKKRINFFTYGLMFLLVIFSPIIFGLDFKNFGLSIDLYFQKFEFNGGIYYLLRYLGRLLTGYNQIQIIGPLLGLIAMILIVSRAYKSRHLKLKAFINFAFFAFLCYLFLTTTVHPWYLCIPVLFSVAVKWRFAVIWSFLIFCTYINYSYDPYLENLWIVTIEYILVFGWVIYELFQYRKQSRFIENKKIINGPD